MDSQIVQDLLPGTGSMGSVPMHHDYKRAVLKPAPDEFSVEVLPPKKFGSGHCYGMRISPINLGSGDVRSLKSSRTKSSIDTEYEVWRRWEDCLWFQDLLETEYKLMARTKRTRLAQGKGVKKDGIYIRSDRAASFESLPPGPDVNDIAKDIHDILPKLTKKGTLFRAGQATIEQRAREFSALVDAFFQDNLPTLVRELRENRIIRDFFGYWRRDQDHDRKMHEQAGSKRVSRASITSSAFSMYFSSSNISLSLPGAFSDIPPNPPLPSYVQEASRKGKQVAKAASFTSTSSSSSGSSGASSSSRSPRTPVSAPAGMSFTVDAAGSLIPTSPTSSDDFSYEQRAGPSSAPLKSSSSHWSLRSSRPVPPQATSLDDQDDAIMFVPDSPWIDSFDSARTGGLQPLPEDQELVPAVCRMTVAEPSSPPARRPRNNSYPDPGNRNCVVFSTPPQVPVPLMLEASSRSHDQSQPSPSEVPDTPMTQTDSSRHSSIALTSFSAEQSRRSSWRTSIGSLSDIPGDPRNRGVDLDDILCMFPVSTDSPLLREDPSFRPSHWPRSSVATMNSMISNSSVDAVLPRRPISPSPGAGLRRSLSAGSRQSTVISPTLSVSIEESWEEQQEDLIDAYFYGLRAPPTPPLSGQITPRRERASTFQVSTPDRFPKPFQNRPPGQFHLPWTPVKSPRMSMASLSSTSPANGADTFTIKAIRQDTIILLRATHSMSLFEVRNKIRSKFASQDGPPLTDAFTIGFAPASSSEGGQSARGRPRSQSTSALSQDSQPRLRFICTEDDWQSALPACTGKLILHIFDRF